MNPLATSLLTLAIALSLAGCDQPKADAPNATTTSSADYAPVRIEHALGTTVIKAPPQRVVAFDMSEVDSVVQLQAPLVGMAKDYVSTFLLPYRDDPGIADVGTTIQPNLERLHALKPDLILISPLQAQSYAELSEIAHLCRACVKKDPVVRIRKGAVEISGRARQAVLAGNGLDLVGVASDEDWIGHQAVAVGKLKAPLLADRENGAHQMLVIAHAAGDPMHDNAKRNRRHLCLPPINNYLVT